MSGAIIIGGEKMADNGLAWISDAGAAILCEGAYTGAALPKGSPLEAARDEFVLAFANGWDERKVRSVCRLAWEEARDAIAPIAEVRGWGH